MDAGYQDLLAELRQITVMQANSLDAIHQTLSLLDSRIRRLERIIVLLHGATSAGTEMPA